MTMFKVPQYNEEAAKLDKIRLINLLGDIVNEASHHPARLTAFQSPLLQLASLEVYLHNNPQESRESYDDTFARLRSLIHERNAP